MNAFTPGKLSTDEHSPSFGSSCLLLASVLHAASSRFLRRLRTPELLEYLELCDENLVFAVDPVRLDRAACESVT